MNKVSLAAITLQAQDYSSGDYTLSPEVYIYLLHICQFMIDNTWLIEGDNDAVDEMVADAMDELLP